MGTINYGTSDYITIGYNCDSIDYDDEFYNDFINEDCENVETILNHYYFYYFHVKLEPGYYEGFYIDIEYNFPLFFDNYLERQEAQEEITTIKHALQEIIKNTNCCAVFPGWCTGYASYKDTLQEIEAAIKAMRQDVQNTPTYRQYNKGA